MVITHSLGFPRIGAKRELKWAVERYWKGEIDRATLESEGKKIRLDNWLLQINAHQDYISVGDFSWYDHVLDTSVLLGVIPERYLTQNEVDLNTYFRMARGRAPEGTDVPACEMTKWFDTNYHYIVPEFHAGQVFKINCDKLLAEIAEAQSLGKPIKPILLGPLSYLWLGKIKDSHFDKLTLLDKLQEAYRHVLEKLKNLNIEWVQIDEPILVLDLPTAWQKAFASVYQYLKCVDVKILLATYFGGLENNTTLACQLPTAGLHIDGVRAASSVSSIVSQWPSDKILSLGIIDGRNIWRTDLRHALQILQPIHRQLGDRLWISTSCSLLHCPVNLEHETKLDEELKSWLAFSVQKLVELNLLAKALNKGESAIEVELNCSDLAQKSRKNSTRIHNPSVKKRSETVTGAMVARQNPYSIRSKVQATQFKFPLFPTTTIGSFPQTSNIREARRDYKLGKIDEETYRNQIRAEIAKAIQKQVDLDIDVLVHGEAERNDMVEYFGELLEGFAFTLNGWVQSYGSRCVKPPIIFGDVSRSKAMTVEWTAYAQSLTRKPVKGMLTGPVTILCWSFVRDDQPRFETAKQIALALRDEVDDLVATGTQIIQIDEPAFREGLPLRQNAWQDYLNQAVYCFKLASSSVSDAIQIHTHMCYSEFNDTIEAIADLDADVITIETSRSDMELLKAFEKFNYPNEIGPGVYDIHSPRIPSVEEIVNLIDKAARFIPVQRLWVNPDCGLKTRDWKETEKALKSMIAATRFLREKHAIMQKKTEEVLS